MHFADALARRSRYATRLIAGNHKEPRLFGLARGGVAALRVFSGTRDRLAPRVFACSFDAAFFLGGAGSLMSRIFSSSLQGSLELAFLLNRASRSFLSRFAPRFFTRSRACSLNTAFVVRRACGGLAARFLARGLAGSFTNGLNTTRLLHIAARLAAIRLPGCRPLTASIVPAGLMIAASALARIAALPIAAWTVVVPLAAGPIVAVAALWFALRFPLPRSLVAIAAAILTVRTAFVFDILPSRMAVAVVARRWLRSGHGCAQWTPVTRIVAAFSDHPVEPLIDRHVDALRRVALGLAGLRAKTSQIPRTARLHPRAQTHIGRGRMRPPLGPALLTKQAHGTALFPRIPTFQDYGKQAVKNSGGKRQTNDFRRFRPAGESARRHIAAAEPGRDGGPSTVS